MRRSTIWFTFQKARHLQWRNKTVISENQISVDGSNAETMELLPCVLIWDVIAFMFQAVSITPANND